MPIEIEHRFLVATERLNELQLDQHRGSFIHQGYITPSPDQTTCRVRIADSDAWLTIKGKSVGAARPEFELPVDLAQAREILQTLTVGSLIEKTRYRIPHCGQTWEVDVFRGENDGLIIAEVELDDENQAIELPTWLGREITSVPRYFNAALAMHPFTKWQAEEKIDPASEASLPTSSR